ncbi:hypothetical protein IKQ19_06620 [Candidatus Saccharibacteria bacterium]|nr:hypothetical protein [Candidatus Saccharibacteria bacterium]
MAKNTYQSPKSVEDVMSMIGIRRIWTRVGRVNNLNSDTARNKLAVIVNRRNKIAHEADYNPVLGCFTALSKEDAMDVRNYLCSIVDVIEENLERQQ